MQLSMQKETDSDLSDLPLCGPRYHYQTEKKIYSCIENQTETLLTLNATGNSHCTYWHSESQLTRHKSNYDKKNLHVVANQGSKEGDVDYPVLNITEMPIPHYKTFIRVTQPHLMRTCLAMLLRLHFHRVRRLLCSAVTHQQFHHRVLPLCSANAVTPQTDVVNIIRNINSATASA